MDWRRAKDDRLRTPRAFAMSISRARWFAGVGIWALYTLTASGRLGNSDAEAMFKVTRSAVEHGRLDAGDCVVSTNACVPGIDGHKYTGYGLPPSIPGPPAYAVALAVADVTRFDCG